MLCQQQLHCWLSYALVMDPPPPRLTTRCWQSLDDFYKDRAADAVRLELAKLTLQHTQAQLDEAADAKTAVLDVSPPVWPS